GTGARNRAHRSAGVDLGDADAGSSGAVGALVRANHLSAAASRLRLSRLGAPMRSVHAANARVGPRHRSSSTSRNSFAPVSSVASRLNNHAVSSWSPKTLAGKSSIGPYRFSRPAAPTAPMPLMPG